MKSIIDSDKGLMNFFTDFTDILSSQTPEMVTEHIDTLKGHISEAQKVYDDAHEKITNHEHFETATKYAKVAKEGATIVGN